ncbi:hypothetical protein KM043_007372 [Ampulex compressa]|nr:hypothetical protein KM043_007372 [Ampulex compressa]
MKIAFRSSRLLRFTILVLSVFDGGAWSMAVNAEDHSPVTRRINLPLAVEASRKFACKEPQQRAYNLKDLTQGMYRNPGESAVQPVYVVLKRCDGYAGCCRSPDMSCTPIKSLVYYEEIQIETWNLVTNDTKRQWIKVEQHGNCTCEESTLSERHRSLTERPEVLLVES